MTIEYAHADDGSGSGPQPDDQETMMLWQVAMAADELISHEEGTQQRLGPRWYALKDALARLADRA